MPSVRESEGVQASIAKLREFLRRQQTVPAEVMQSYQNELKEAIKSETPYKSGTLEQSVYVNVAKLGTSRTTLTAGANATRKGYNYALIQHERDDFKHPIKGKAHYVEDPFEQITEKIIVAMQEGIQYPK